MLLGKIIYYESKMKMQPKQFCFIKFYNINGRTERTAGDDFISRQKRLGGGLDYQKYNLIKIYIGRGMIPGANESRKTNTKKPVKSSYKLFSTSEINYLYTD